MYNYDYRPYFNTLHNDNESILSTLSQLTGDFNSLRTVLLLVAGIAVAILAFMIIKNWRFRK